MIIQRINKFITNYLFCSRSKVDFIIRNGKDLDNGYLAEIGMNLNPNFDSIYVTGRELKNLNSQSHTILLNKPKNVITNRSYKHKRKPFIDRQRINFSNISLGNLKDCEWKLINNAEFNNIQ